MAVVDRPVLGMGVVPDETESPVTVEGLCPPRLRFIVCRLFLEG